MEVRVSLLDSDEDCLDIVSEVQLIHTAALEERVLKGCMSGRIVATALKPVLPTLGNTAEVTFNGVVTDFKHSTSQGSREDDAELIVSRTGVSPDTASKWSCIMSWAFVIVFFPDFTLFPLVVTP